MERILELLARAAELTADEQAELQTLLADNLSAESIVDVDDETLAEIAGLIPAAFDAAAAAGTPSVELLTELAETTDRIGVEDEARQTASAEAQAVIDELAARVHGTTDDTETDEAEVDETPEPVAELEDENESEDVEPELVTAAARAGRPGRTPLGRLNRGHRLPEVEPETPSARAITAASGAGTFNTGQTLDLDQLDQLVAEQAKRMARQQGPYKTNVARFTMEYPEDRRLSPSDAQLNQNKIDRVLNSFLAGFAKGKLDPRFEAMVAAGGFCAPLPVRYDQNVVGDTDRPVAGALGGYDASRGGVRHTPPPALGDIRTGGPGDDAAVGVWTGTDDEEVDPEDPATWKPIQRIDCGDEQSVYLQLVTARLEIGNLQAMTWPERVRAFIELVAVQYARVAETQLLNQIQAASTATAGFGTILGSARDLVAEWATAANAIRLRNRVARSAPVRVIAPESARLSMLIDFDRQLAGDDVFGDGEARLARALRQYNITVTWTPDLLVPGAVGGVLPQVPTTMSYALYLEGEFAFLDGVNLDFGFQSNTPIRDSGLNARNDHELFMEGGEAVAKFGSTQSLWVTTAVCPTGATGGTADVACTPGS